MGERQKQLHKKRPLGNYGLSIVLALLFLVSWVGQAVSQWKEFESQQRAHGELAEVAEFGWEFAASTMENWQSEFLQLLAFAVLTSFLYHKGSAESKDSDEEIQAALERIEARLDRLEPSGHGERDGSAVPQPL